MENAVDAIKMGFAVLVFIMALSLTMFMFTQAMQTATVVLHSSDVSEFMTYQGFENYETAKTSSERIVGLETIIPTLYKYYKENYTVIFRNSSGGFLEVYETRTRPNSWSTGYKNKYFGGESTKICSFDVDEETRRYEPWTGSVENYKKNLDAFLSGGKFDSPSGNGVNYNYRNTGFINTYKDREFIETLGEYTYDAGNDEMYDEDYSSTLVKNRKKRVIIYTLR